MSYGLEDLVRKVVLWAEERNLIFGSTPEKQFSKTLEEVEELKQGLEDGITKEIIDGIGDVTVTLIILSEMHGFEFQQCLQYAYDEIKDRKGKMIDGIFVKEADLPKSMKAS